MSVEDNIRILNRWFQEVWNEGRLETIHELLSPDAVAIGQAGSGISMRGPEQFARFVQQLRAAFPDIKVSVEDVFGAGDKVALRWTGQMTHLGDALGIPATGKTIHISGITLVRLAHGKIMAGWDNWDQLGMLEQIGAYNPKSVALGKTA